MATGGRFNLFFAIFPDEAAAVGLESLAEKLRRDHGLNGRPLKTVNFHVSLHGLPRSREEPRRLIERYMEAADKLTAAPFLARFNRAMSFERTGAATHPLVLVSDDDATRFEELHSGLYMALRQAGVRGLAKSGFTPHVTLLYDERRLAEDHPIVPPVCWEANKVVLVLSHVGEARYDKLKEWPLGERAE